MPTPSRPRTVLVTGAASGIGRAVAQRLCTRGDHVLAADIDAQGLAALDRAEPAVETTVLDVRDPAAWTAAVAHAARATGALDLLVHAAGVLSPIAGHRLDPETIHRLVDVNVKGTIFGMNAAARAMLEVGGGHMVVVASMAALVPVPGISVYSATKHAARAYALAVAGELAPRGITVSVVCPAVVDTPMMDLQLDAEDAALTFSSRRPLTVDEVAGAIVERAIDQKKRQVIVEAPWSGQGVAARVADAFPGLAAPLASLLRRRARTRQARLRKARRTPPS